MNIASSTTDAKLDTAAATKVPLQRRHKASENGLMCDAGISARSSDLSANNPEHTPKSTAQREEYCAAPAAMSNAASASPRSGCSAAAAAKGEADEAEATDDAHS
jgi:hypothetical protein